MCSGQGSCDDGAMGAGACTCTGGFTGTDCAVPPACSGAGDNVGDVMIVTVMYDAPNGGAFTEPAGEYVMLYNNSCADIDLDGWELCDNAGCLELGARTIAQGRGLAIIHTTGAEGLADYGCGADAAHQQGDDAFATAVWFSNNLSNSGDRVIMNNAAGTQIDAMSYGSDSSVMSPSTPDRSAGVANQRIGYPWSGTLPANTGATVWEASPLNGHICDLTAAGVFQ